MEDEDYLLVEIDLYRLKDKTNPNYYKGDEKICQTWRK